MPHHPLEARLIVPSSPAVSTIFSDRGLTQVFYAVVATNQILVIYLIFRPSPVVLKPCKAMGHVTNAVDIDRSVPMAINLPR